MPRLGVALVGVPLTLWSRTVHDAMATFTAIRTVELLCHSLLVALRSPTLNTSFARETRIRTEIPKNETVMLVGGGLGNAVLFSIGQALRFNNCNVLYFAGYKKPKDCYKKLLKSNERMNEEENFFEQESFEH
jgi:hypothetical protein